MGRRHPSPSSATLRSVSCLTSRLRLEVRGAIGDRTGIQVGEQGDAVGDPVGDARDDYPRVTVSEEDHLAQIL